MVGQIFVRHEKPGKGLSPEKSTRMLRPLSVAPLAPPQQLAQKHASDPIWGDIITLSGNTSFFWVTSTFGIIKMKDCSGLGAGVAYLIANFGSSENYSQLAGD